MSTDIYSEILPKEQFYHLTRQEKIRKITLWRSNYSTKQIVEAMGFNTNQAFYNMLNRLGLPTSWNLHRELWRNGKLDMEDVQEEVQQQKTQEEETQNMKQNNSEIVKLKVDLVGEVELTRLPQIVAMAQEFGLHIKVENL